MSIDPRNFDTFACLFALETRECPSNTKCWKKAPSRDLCGVDWIHWYFTTSNTSTSLDNRDVAIRRRQLHPRDQSVAKLKSWKLIRCTDKCRRKESDVCALASQAHGSLGSNSCISFGDSCAALELYNLCKKRAPFSEQHDLEWEVWNAGSDVRLQMFSTLL